MMPEISISKIMRTGLAIGLIFMLIGGIFSVTGRYHEEINLSIANLLDGSLFVDGAGLMYLGTLSIILTPMAVLFFLFFYYLFSNTKKYSVYCLSIILVLIIVVSVRV